jgi:hypothetical protein
MASTALAVFAGLASFLPLAFLNWRHTGSWKGYLPESGSVPWWHFGPTQELASPFWGIVGNAFSLTAQNLLPPFFPWASAWNAAMHHFLQTPLGSHFVSFENFGRLGRSVTSSSAGAGLTVVIVALLSFCFARRSREAVSPLARPAVVGWLQWTPWLALLLFMAKVGSYQNARYLAPYYPLLLPVLLLRPGMAALVRARWWQRLVLLLMTATLALTCFDRGRVFVPSSVFARLEASPQPGFLKVLDAYYQSRLAVASYWEFTTRHSAGETVVGYATITSGIEPGMWRPWGHGRVERILVDDTPAWVRSQGIRVVFVDEAHLAANKETIEQWLKRFDATLVDQLSFATDPGVHFRVYCARLQATNSTPAETGSK